MRLALDHLWSDVRYALRQFARRPGLTSAALVSLAGGLGSVITVFTLVDAVILRPLPVRAPHELVWLRDPSFSFPVFQEVEARGRMLASVFAWELRTMRAQWTGEPEPTAVLLASGRIHETLGLRPAAGRLLGQGDAGHSAAEAHAVAVLSHGAWQRHFGGEASAIGRTIRIDGTPFTIVGVTPPDFFGVAVGQPVDVTIPVTMLPRMHEDERTILASGSSSWLGIMGRLRPGLSPSGADAAFQTIWPQILRATVDRVAPESRPRYLTFASGLEPGAAGYSPVRVQFQEPLWLLLGLVGLLLVAACATVANLRLAAMSGRGPELGVRLALGAARRRIVQQLLVEGLLLAAAGTALGLLFSFWAADALVRLLSTSYDVVAIDLSPDRRVLAFAAVLATAVTAIFSVAPIGRALRLDPGALLEAGSRQTGGPRPARLAQALVAVQVAISLTLLAGSTLFVRNLLGVLAIDVGFARENLLVIGVDALATAPGRGTDRDDADGQRRYFEELLRRLRETPGVQSASLSIKPPISNEQGSWWDRFAVDGAPPPPWGDRTYLNAVTPGYFATLRLPLLAGRDFGPGDREGAPPVIVINAALARARFGDASPLGRQLVTQDTAGTTRYEVIGVVGDTVYQELGEARRRIAYLPYAQAPPSMGARNAVAEARVTQPTPEVARAVRATVRRFDPAVPLSLQTVETRIDESLRRERLLALLAAFIGSVALLLACGALGGLMAHLVGVRTREIGLRLALGAERRAVLALVLRQALEVALVGVAAGLGLAWAGAGLVAGFLTGVEPGDVLSLALAAAIVLITTAAASYLPARRASRVDPMVALRID